MAQSTLDEQRLSLVKTVYFAGLHNHDNYWDHSSFIKKCTANMSAPPTFVCSLSFILAAQCFNRFNSLAIHVAFSSGTGSWFGELQLELECDLR